MVKMTSLAMASKQALALTFMFWVWLAMYRSYSATVQTHTSNSNSEQLFLEELSDTIGEGQQIEIRRQIDRFEQMLRPMFGSVAGTRTKVGPAAASYMLHRAFVNRHGWHIKGLAPTTPSFASWGETSPTSVWKERGLDSLVRLYETHYRNNEFGARDIAVLAAAYEQIVQQESLQRLGVSYLANHWKKSEILNGDDVGTVLDTYMSIYIMGSERNSTAMSISEARRLHKSIDSMYPSWPQTQRFLRDVHNSAAPQRNYLYFNEVEKVVVEIGERFGAFQDIECREFKDWLVEIEDQAIGGAGRVRLADFYNASLHGKWQFSERKAYLRHSGALDESDVSNPRVIIPNYIHSQSNCLGSSAHYSVCCLDECETILGRLEQSIAARAATPTEIVNLVRTIPSATVPGNRTLSPWLRERLEEIANRHHGRVPLHGRLFSQWLHFAYPRECKFPHVTDSDLEPELQAGNSEASDEERKRIIAAAPKPKHRGPLDGEGDKNTESAMWSGQEEFVEWQQGSWLECMWLGWIFFLDNLYGREFAVCGATISFSVLLRQMHAAPLSGSKESRVQHHIL
jgi:hypothetical protein